MGKKYKRKNFLAFLATLSTIVTVIAATVSIIALNVAINLSEGTEEKLQDVINDNKQEHSIDRNYDSTLFENLMSQSDSLFKSLLSQSHAQFIENLLYTRPHIYLKKYNTEDIKRIGDNFSFLFDTELYNGGLRPANNVRLEQYILFKDRIVPVINVNSREVVMAPNETINHITITPTQVKYENMWFQPEFRFVDLAIFNVVMHISYLDPVFDTVYHKAAINEFIINDEGEPTSILSVPDSVYRKDLLRLKKWLISKNGDYKWIDSEDIDR